MRKRLWPLAATKFLTSFNDNAFKTVVMFVAMEIIRVDMLARAGAGEAVPRALDAAIKARHDALLAFGAMVFMLPFVTFPTVAGWMADRYSKRTVINLAKLAEMVVMGIGMVCFVLLDRFGIFPLLVAVFLMALQSTFFSPAFFGILPESFDESKLSNANGVVELLNFLGIILGCACGAFTEFIPETYFAAPTARISVMIGLPFIVVAAVGYALSLLIQPTKPAAPASEPFGWQLLTNYFRDFRYVVASRPIWLCVLGVAFFFSLGSLMMTSLMSFGLNVLNLSKMHTSMLTVAVALGIGLGCFVAGAFSDEKVEFGLVPIGVWGMTVFFVNLMVTMTFHGALVNCFGIGFFGGFFVLPLTVYIQERTPAEVRGKTLAQANAVSFWGMLGVAVLMLVLTGGAGDVGADANFWMRARANFFVIDTRQLYLGAAIVLFLTSLYVFWLLPEFLLRLLVLLLTRFVYHIRIYGRERLPRTGPALLIANSVSLVDGLLVAAASSRPIHFVVPERYCQQSWLRPFVRWARLISLPEGGGDEALESVYEQTREVLRQGELLCVFPEGSITGNGMMGEFKEGYLAMLPEDVEAPVIPVHLGLVWGSIFSRRYGNIGLRPPRRLPYPVTVSFGPPLARDASPMAARLAVSELASEAESHRQPDEMVFPQLFVRRMRRRPLARLLKDSSGSEPPNIAVLIRAYALAGKIRRACGPEEEYIGVVLPSGTGGVIVACACMLADRIPVFLNFTASRAAIDHAVAKCKIKTIYSSRLFLEKAKLPELPGTVFLEDVAGGITGGDKVKALLAALLAPSWLARRLYFPKTAADVHRPATILFSSGSTGVPKGAVLSHHNFQANASAVVRTLGLERDDVLLGSLPFFHSFGFMATLWLPVCWGFRVVYHPNPLDAARIGELVAEEKATMLFATPTFLQGYTRKCQAEQFATLRLVITGAEKLPARIADKFAEKFGVVPIEGYGTTELSPVVSVNIPVDIREVGRGIGKPGSIGQPLPGISVKTVDPFSRELLDENEEGALLIKGPNVMQGYLDDPERTAAALQDGWYDTGDMARIDPDGFLFITGRLARFSKIAGEMVPHAAVEEEIHLFLDLQETRAVVTTVTDEKRGERLLVLHLPLAQEPREIVVGLRERGLPNLWVPKAGDFHQIAAIPLLGSGKLDLAAAQEMAARLGARD